MEWGQLFIRLSFFFLYFPPAWYWKVSCFRRCLNISLPPRDISLCLRKGTSDGALLSSCQDTLLISMILPLFLRKSSPCWQQQQQAHAPLPCPAVVEAEGQSPGLLARYSSARDSDGHGTGGSVCPGAAGMFGWAALPCCCCQAWSSVLGR